VESIQRYWREHLGWKGQGYHYIIEPSGMLRQLTPDDKIANGVRGYNKHSIHISYIGGIDSKGKPFNNMTLAQNETMRALVDALKVQHPDAEVLGHRDLNPHKACPSFDVKSWMDSFDCA
jgi:N-acetylmuramoyl-L-alanine amidase